ncbi:beta-lactamase-like protein [Scenedesmus sp. NREL 46B-D3]|nr:beta-lactamase-like protein [Scenedesmus sp. NREL 46B-D3]
MMASVQCQLSMTQAGFVLASTSSEESVSAKGSCQLLLLGVAQDAGVPQTGCACTNCAAVWSGTMPRQFAVSAAVIDAVSCQCWLLDCSPDFKDQYHALQEYLDDHGLGDVQLSGVLLTHLHMGHYLGLMQFGREAMDWGGLQVWGTQSVLSFFSSNEPWKTYIRNGNFVLKQLQPGVELRLSDTVSVAAAAVPHRAEFSDAVGYYIRGARRTAFYLPDIDSWDAWQAAGTDMCQVVRSVDLALLDGCFFSTAELPGRDLSQIPHPLITDTAARLKGIATGDKEVVMVHLNHSNPCYREGRERQQAIDAGLRIGRQGQVFKL